MHLFKFVVSFIAVGGATFALFTINRAPWWVIAVSLAMGGAAVITALPHLPEAVRALGESLREMAKWSPPQIPPIAGPFRNNSSSETAIAILPPQPQCAAVVTSNDGAWGASARPGRTCAERLDKARQACVVRARGVCGSYAAGAWVAAIRCGMPVPYGFRSNSFAGCGSSESEAFADAAAHAAQRGFPAG